MLVNKETLLKVQTKKVKKEDQVRYDKINKDILIVSELIKEIYHIDNKGDKMDKSAYEKAANLMMNAVINVEDALCWLDAEHEDRE